MALQALSTASFSGGSGRFSRSHSLPGRWPTAKANSSSRSPGKLSTRRRTSGIVVITESRSPAMSATSDSSTGNASRGFRGR